MRLFMAAVVLISFGCSHHDKMKQHHQTHSGQPSAITADAFANSKDLTTQQKSELKAIYGRTFSQSRAYRAELADKKSQLFETLSSRDYKSKDISKLKTEIIEIDQKRLNLMFAALAEVQGIVGYGKDKENIYKQLRDYDMSQTNADYNIR